MRKMYRNLAGRWQSRRQNHREEKKSEAVFRTILPMLKKLETLHRNGHFYGQIRPDHIEITEENRKIPVSPSEANGYTPPEFMEEGAVPGPYSDIYSVTGIIYRNITGRDPESAYERTLGEQLTLPSDLGIRISPAFEKILQKGLAVKKEERYQNAEEMLSDIEAAFADQKAKNGKKIKPETVRKLLVYTACAALAAACLFGIYFGFHPGWPEYSSYEERIVQWENPKQSIQKGNYQKGKDAVISDPVLLFFRGKSDGAKDPDAGYRKLTDLKNRLDVLKTPYRIGLSREDPSEVVVKIAANRIPAFYAYALDQKTTMDLSAGWSCMYAGGVDFAEPYTMKGGETGIRLVCRFSEAEAEYVKKYIDLAEKNGRDTLQLLIGEITVAQGKISGQSEMGQGIFYFPDLILPQTKQSDLGLICRCLNALNHSDANAGDSYTLVKIVGINERGMRVKEGKSFTCGQFRFLTEKDREYVQKLGKQYGLVSEVKETWGSQKICFTGKAQGIDTMLREMAELMDGVLNHTDLQHIFWDKIETDLEDPDGRYKIHAVFQAEDQIVFSYLENPFFTLESGENDSSMKFGSWAVHGQIMEGDPDSEPSNPEYRPLDAAAENQFSLAEETETFLKSSRFFQKYGGSATWEYLSGA